MKRILALFLAATGLAFGQAIPPTVQIVGISAGGGGGGSGTVGPGTTNTVAKFTASTTVGDSKFTDDGTTPKYNTVELPTISSTSTLTNKRITLRIATLTDAATVTPATDSYDGGILTSLSQGTTIANPTGTPTEGQKYTLRIKSTSTQTLAYGNQFRGSSDLALPSATTGSSKTDYMVFSWNVADSKWDLLGKTFGF